MTHKGQRVIDAIKRRKPYNLNDPMTKEKFPNEFTLSKLDPVGPADQGMAVLRDISGFQSDHEAFVKSLARRVDVQ